MEKTTTQNEIYKNKGCVRAVCKKLKIECVRYERKIQERIACANQELNVTILYD